MNLPSADLIETVVMVPRMMEKTLLGLGVRPDQISVIPQEVEALDFALKEGRRDDLLLVFGDNCPRCWKQIVNFGEAVQQASTLYDSDSADFFLSLPTLSTAIDLPHGELIHDERGVRLARVEED